MNLLPRLRILRLAVAAVLALLLTAACGGGGDNSSPVRVSPASPTPTVEGTQDPDATGTPDLVPLPDRPDNVFDGGRAVADYLAGGEPDLENCLPELVREWDLAPIAGRRCFIVDIDGDNRDEFIFIVTSASSDSVQLPGDIWFFEDEEGNRALYQSGRGLAHAPLENVAVVGLQDLTNDGRPDLVAIWETCGASTCTAHLIIASHHTGPMLNLAPSNLEIPSLESFEIDDQNRIQLRGGIIGSVGAGPQRSVTTQLQWAGSAFRVTERQNEPEYLIHLVNDADEALAGGQYAEAIELFEAVLEDVTLPDWKLEIGETAGTEELHAYSLFRAGLAAARSGNPSGSRAFISRAATEYSNTLHGSGAGAYLNALDSGQSPNQACTSMEQFLEQPALGNLINAFWDYGYENPVRTVHTLCR